MPDAARVTDNHTCPVTSGSVPHEGGKILPKGAPDVLIGHLPAARKGDRASCKGPVDEIADGSATVFIGGEPAARVGDGTMHGGKITDGCPTVHIGNDPQAASFMASSAPLVERCDDPRLPPSA
jgi:uncharacterized Zn-binding protein involved in type VI secretion